MPTIQELERKLRSVRREIRNLIVMGMDPKQPADQLAMIRELEQFRRELSSACARWRWTTHEVGSGRAGSSKVLPQAAHRKTPGLKVVSVS